MERKKTSQGLIALRPFNFVVVFWGEKFRDFFLNLCLPSLLAPHNVPHLKDINKSRLIIFSTKEDWEAIQPSVLLDKIKEYLELIFLDIGFPGKGDLPQLHMSKGHKAAIQWIWKRGEYGIFLAPDLVLSDGSIARITQLAQGGKKAVLAVALRFDMDKCVNEFKDRGLMRSNESLMLPPRVLAEIAATSLHSEIQRFNWDSPYFCNYPISVYFSVPHETGIVVNSCSWAMVLVDFVEIKQLNDCSLDENTIDAHFIHQNLFQLHKTEKMHLITDSDEMLFVSLTSELDMSMYPLQEERINGIPLLGNLKKFMAVNLVLHSNVMDPFKRWAFKKDVVIHGGDLSGNWERIRMRSQRLARLSVGRLAIVGLMVGAIAPFIHGPYLAFIRVRDGMCRNLRDSREFQSVDVRFYRRVFIFLRVFFTLVLKKIVRKKEAKEFLV